jgi:hypothetical protein
VYAADNYYKPFLALLLLLLLLTSAAGLVCRGTLATMIMS